MPDLISNECVASFDPTTITGFQLWLDASDPSTITLNGSDVSSWVPKAVGTTTQDFAQSTASLQPAYDDPDNAGTGVNGLAAIQFAEGEYLEDTSTNNTNQAFNHDRLDVTKDACTYMAIKTNVNGTNVDLDIVIRDGGTGDPYEPCLIRMNSSSAALMSSRTGYNQFNSTSTISNGVHILCWETDNRNTGVDTRTRRYFIDSKTADASTDTNGAWAYTAKLEGTQIGSVSATNGFAGHICEVIHFSDGASRDNYAPGTTNGDLVMDYLADKWGVTLV